HNPTRIVRTAEGTVVDVTPASPDQYVRDTPLDARGPRTGCRLASPPLIERAPSQVSPLAVIWPISIRSKVRTGLPRVTIGSVSVPRLLPRLNSQAATVEPSLTQVEVEAEKGRVVQPSSVAMSELLSTKISRASRPPSGSRYPFQVSWG